MKSAVAPVSVRASDPERATAEFAADVRHYLARRPRQLPSRYFYDALGSALFDAICELPWYHVTRAEQRLLHAHAARILGERCPARVVELGSGNGEKLMTLVSAGLPAAARLDVHLVDVSGAALTTAGRALSALAGVHVITHEATYEAGLRQARAESGTGGSTLAVFLGSNIGNFDPEAAERFLRGVHDSLEPGDSLLLGADLCKPESDLLLAYDDPLEVTAAFNRNLLVRINRELEGDFDLGGFDHEAIWNAAHSRVEMHLVSQRLQRVRIAAAKVEVTLREGERIWTESSYKYAPAEVDGLLVRCGFRPRLQWIDAEGHFALTLSDRGGR